ncbi:SDR family NAD(P)-dependent oxidoreductase [Sorangium sp. So ce124]|uniref:SDR family NAD(P)-dependent oxidoreductase n=1 Tax=Sorangium sp. So ce124 TaxID=3133280 RepID=UPI003F638F2C
MTRARALIAGGGGAVGVALGRELRARGYQVVSAARNRAGLEAELGATECELLEVELTSEESVRERFGPLEDVEVFVYNAGRIDLAPLAETTAAMFLASLQVNALGAFHCARVVASSMLARGRGTMIFMGATASVRGGARTSAFAAGKHALRGLAASLAKELGPQGVHVAHLVLDGKVWGERTRQRFPDARREACLEADAVARTVTALIEQPRSAWTFELDLRPFVERWS